MTVKLTKIEAGHYTTPDGRFDIRNTYDPSGWAHVRYAGFNWKLTDKATTNGRSLRFDSLTDARSYIQSVRDHVAKMAETNSEKSS